MNNSAESPLKKPKGLQGQKKMDRDTDEEKIGHPYGGGGGGFLDLLLCLYCFAIFAPRPVGR